MGADRVRLAERRRILGLSQERLAHLMGVDTSTVARWERGTTEPQPTHRPRLADVLHLSVTQVDALLTECRQARTTATQRRIGPSRPTVAARLLRQGREAHRRAELTVSTRAHQRGPGMAQVRVTLTEAHTGSLLAVLSQVDALALADQLRTAVMAHHHPFREDK